MLNSDSSSRLRLLLISTLVPAGVATAIAPSKAIASIAPGAPAEPVRIWLRVLGHAQGTDAAPIWSIPPAAALALVVAGLAYALAWRWASRSESQEPRDLPASAWEAAAFYAGLLALAAAFGGPIEAYSDELLAMHMVQHLLLLQLAPPLLWLGRPLRLARLAFPGLLAGPLRPLGSSAFVRLRSGLIRSLVRAIGSPWLVGLFFNLNLLLWHLPPAYDASLRSEAVHGLEHITFLLSALAFWWLVLEPGAAPEGRHSVYGLCFASCMAGMLVALALSFAPLPLYPWYRAQAGLVFGLDALADQRLGGLIMFLGGLAYLGLLLRLLARDAAAR
jgi:cytochrome c oxidase assembly factor CtaG